MTITFKPPEAIEQTSDWLRLEQEPWPSDNPGGFTGWLADQGRQPSVWNLFDLFAEYAAGCNGKGKVETTIHVMTSRPDLPYSLAVTAGELTGPVRAMTDVDATVNVDLDTVIDMTRQGIGTVTAALWQGPVFDESGNRTAPPDVTVHGAAVAVARPVIGVLLVRGRGRRDDWTLTMDHDLEVTVMAVHGGRVERLPVSPPRTSGCSGGVSFEVTGRDRGGGQEKCVRRIIEVDLCSGEVLSDTTEPAPCD